MDTRRKKRAILPYRLTLWFVALTGLAIAYLDSSPLAVDAEMPAEQPVELERESESDVIIVLDYAKIRSSGESFSERDFSVAWINLFEQELGPITIATPRSLSENMLDRARVLVLTSSVANDIPEVLVDKLRERMLDNRMLVVSERPQGILRERYGANAKVGSQRATGVTYVRDVPEPFNRQLVAMPVSTEYLGSTAPRKGAETLMSLDGAPVIYAVPVGEGRIVIIDMDLGEQLVSLQQGRPDESFRVKSSGPIPHTWELALDESLRTSNVPYADLLERFIVHGVINRYSPFPTFWPFPAGAEGVVIATHSDAALGDGGGWMLRYETERKSTSTLLTTSDSGLTASEAAVIDRLGGGLGLLWRMQHTPHQRLESFGIGELQPFARPVSLDEQRESLAETATANIVSGRVMGHYWTSEWSAAFAALSSQKIRIDSSYSPGTTSGYAFGTGLPFLALDSSGLPLSIREFPVVVPDQPVGGPTLQKLLEESQSGHHQAIGVDVTPASFAEFPDLGQFENWVQMFDQAESTNHLVMSARRFDAFSRARRASSIRSRVIRDAQLPRARPGPNDEDSAKPTEIAATLLRVTLEAKRSGFELTVPERIGGRSFVTARQRVNRVGDELVSGELETRQDNYSGFAIRRVPLSAGFNTIDVYYR